MPSSPDVTAGMWLASLKYGEIDTFQLRSSVYYVPDILTSNYNDVSATFAATDDFRVRVGGQFMVQGSNGLNLLTGNPFGMFRNVSLLEASKCRVCSQPSVASRPRYAFVEMAPDTSTNAQFRCRR